MTRRDLAKLERQVKRAREDRKRLSEFAEAGPSFTPRSDGDGNRQSVPEEARERIWHPERDHERRRPGFPSQQGPLARQQATIGNERLRTNPEPKRDPLWWSALKVIWWTLLVLGLYGVLERFLALRGIQ